MGVPAEQLAALLEGKKVYRMFKVPGKRQIFEDEYTVQKFRRLLEPHDPGRGSKPSEGSRKQRLLQFFAAEGGMRTIAVDDIVDIT